jgi:dihydrofolate synthase/folylpolyglutamate synthase
MQYDEAIDWLFQQFPSYQQIGKTAYKPDLGNIQALCNELAIDFSATKFIHIAGTNGKGSTSNMLTSILMEAGYKVGVFTSPHLLDFRERIAINNQLISEETVISFCEKIQKVNTVISPSFFEITLAMALDFFIKSSSDICVIETGLGGRLDATNIITPILSIITNISFDHTDLLGDTLEKIAFEKAGIIKPTIPVVIGEFQAETFPVFQQKANKLNSELIPAFEFDFKIDPHNYKSINERTVRCAINKLNTFGFTILDKHIEAGIQNLISNRNFIGRFQIIQNNPLVILDVAHNEAGLKKTFELLKKEEKGQLFVIYGASSDKDLTSILPLFPIQGSYFFTSFISQRSCTIEELKQKSTNSELSIQYFDSLSLALEKVKQTINKEDTLLITGSFFLVSDFLRLFSSKDLQI